MRLQILSILLTAVAACTPMKAQTTDDNILISGCTDTYTFFVDKETNTPMVKNRKQTDYIAHRMGADLQPATYYGEFITLDGASAKGSAKAQYKSITPQNVFFDDTKVCYFNLNLDRKGKTTSATFKRTFRDLRYFTRISLAEEFFVRQKEVKFIIPPALFRFRITEKNLPANIVCHRSLNADGDSVIAYTATALPALKDEAGMPSSNAIHPFLLVTGQFDTYRDLYRWSNGVAQVDCTVPDADKLIAEITAGCSTPMEKIRATYAWVQQNIRYIAFEAGISGHRPDTPAQVLRKRYGDCKGMALLLKTLLRVQGFDARLTDIGTADIPWTMTELPTLASANHMICTLFHEGRTYYLDATNEYIPAEHTPQGIQGQEAMIENGDDCLMQRLPVLPARASTDSLCYQWTLAPTNDGEQLASAGTATLHLSGDMKEYFLTSYHSYAKNDQHEYLLRVFNGDGIYQAGNVEWAEHAPQASEAVLKALLTGSNNIQRIDNECYIELNPRNELFAVPIDTARRTQDYCLPLRCRVVRQAEMRLPAACTVTHLPPVFHIETPQGTLMCSFRHDRRKGTLEFRQVMEIREKRIPLRQISQWNEALRQWHEASSEQVILKIE